MFDVARLLTYRRYLSQDLRIHGREAGSLGVVRNK